MSKPKVYVVHLKGSLEGHGEVVQRMTFEAVDRDDARDFAEGEAAREAEGAVPVGGSDVERRRLVRERTFKVVKIEAR